MSRKFIRINDISAGQDEGWQFIRSSAVTSVEIKYDASLRREAKWTVRIFGSNIDIERTFVKGSEAEAFLDDVMSSLDENHSTLIQGI